MAEQRISCEDAKTKHGITCEHGQMDNGELRFRLKKGQDFTAYIRTEASKTGAWQNSHYHKTSFETYIVQDGWIAYAEAGNGSPVVTIYEAGDVFTTEPMVVHNIYMPADAVIHTVKHGQIGSSGDRLVDE